MSAAAAALKVGFAGTPAFARSALQQLLAAGYGVPLVLTQPDRPAGRGLRLQASPVKELAQQHGIAVAQPRSLRLDGRYPEDAAAAQAALQAAQPDVLVVAAYGLLLPPWVLALPPHGALNIHASLLPRWRGAAPIQRAIEAGDAHTGITIMQMDAGLDTGDMLLAEPEAITASDTTGSLHDRLAARGARLIVAALQRLERGALQCAPQPAAGVTYAHKIDKAEAPIDWSAGATVIERRVRAFDPFPGASFQAGGETVKLWRAEVTPRPAAPARPGEVIDAVAAGPVVACGSGALRLLEVQRPGGRRTVAAALRLQRGMLLAGTPGATGTTAAGNTGSSGG